MVRQAFTLVLFGFLGTALAGGCAGGDEGGLSGGDLGAGGGDAAAPAPSPSPSPSPSPTGTAPAPTSTSEPSGSCNPDFCPEDSFGERCCVSPNGPCGVDMGMGCTSATTTDPDAGS